VTATPVVVCIDVEPDVRQLADAPRWTGFEALAAWMTEERDRLSRVTGAPARFSWFVRLDSQIAEMYGSPAWPLVHYGRQIAALRAAGDAFGVHVHAYRRAAADEPWMADDGDQAWVDRNVADSLDVFARTLGFACRLFRFADRWMNDATVRCLEARGVAIDLSLEPGLTADSTTTRREVHSGSSPDLSSVPRVPYRPSRADFRVPDPDRADGLWMMPVTTARLSGALAWARRLRYRPGFRRHSSFNMMALNLNLAPAVFRALGGRLLASPLPPCLVLPVHTYVGAKADAMARVAANLRWVTGRAARLRPVFCTPEEALAAATGG